MVGTRSYNQVRRAEARERTRAALLESAMAAFMTGRWEQVSLEEIAAQAGVTKQTLLRHFGSKTGLLEAGALRAREEINAQRLSSPTNDIAGAVDNLLDHYEERGRQGLRIAAMDGGGAIAEVGRMARRLHYDWVEHAFGTWLRRVDGTERARLRAALIVVCDVHAWQILSRDLGLARTEVRDTLVLAIRRLLEEGT